MLLLMLSIPELTPGLSSSNSPQQSRSQPVLELRSVSARRKLYSLDALLIEPIFAVYKSILIEERSIHGNLEALVSLSLYSQCMKSSPCRLVRDQEGLNSLIKYAMSNCTYREFCNIRSYALLYTYFYYE